MSKPMRIYVAGPYSAPTRDGVEANIQRAMRTAASCMFRGHDAHCPHTATDPIEQYATAYHKGWLDYERWMRLDFGLIRHWATALFYIAPSPGTDRELALAEELGLTVFRSLDEVPDLRKLGGRL